MVNVYFSDNFENDIFIATCQKDFVMKYIRDFINKCNNKFVMYYCRTWKDENDNKKTWYDVGSHSEFFYTIEVQQNE